MIIEHIFILLDSGQLLFSENYSNVEMMDDLVAGFMSAMNSFARESAQGEMRSLILSQKKFTYALSGGLLFILISNLDANTILLETLLDKIKKQFFTRYNDLLKSYGGQISLFADFHEDLKAYFQSFNDLTINCATCHKIIPGEFLKPDNDIQQIYFCCVSCKMLYKPDPGKIISKKSKNGHSHSHFKFWKNS